MNFARAHRCRSSVKRAAPFRPELQRNFPRLVDTDLSRPRLSGPTCQTFFHKTVSTASELNRFALGVQVNHSI